MDNDWVQEAPFAVTVCDRDGKITAMNSKACKVFEKDGGAALIGRDLLACHPEPSRSKLKEWLAGSSPIVNAYTIEKKGVKKLIYQFSRFENGSPVGMVEFSLELPPDMPHFVRK